MKKAISALVFSLFIIAQVFVLCELGIRTYEYFVYKIPFLRSISTHFDPKFGWVGSQGVFSSSRPNLTLFVVGDSYTNGEGVSTEHVYYNYLQHYAKAYVFVYGGSGFGNLQEYLVMDEYLDLVNPDLILWQVDGNDFENNTWEIERSTSRTGNIMIRPYLINGKIEYRHPRPYGFLAIRSRFFYRVLIAIEKYQKLLTQKGIILNHDSEIKRKYFDASYKVTAEIVKMAKHRAGKTPVVAFISDGTSERIKSFSKIFKENGIPFIDQVPQVMIEETRKRKKDLSAGPGVGHWSPEGHLIVAQFLVKELIELGYFPPESQT